MDNKYKKAIAGMLGALAITIGIAYALHPSTSAEEVTHQIVTPQTTNGPNSAETTFSKTRVIKAETKNVLYFNVVVLDPTVDAAISYLSTLSPSSDVWLLINSPGGSVFAGARFIAYLENHKNIHTVCVSLCASMAAHIHQSTDKRYMYSSGTLMFHPASGGVEGQIENMISQLNMFKELVDGLDAKIAYRAGINYNEFKRKVAFQYWVLANTAVTTKLADGVVLIETDDARQPYGVDLYKLMVSSLTPDVAGEKLRHNMINLQN